MTAPPSDRFRPFVPDEHRRTTIDEATPRLDGRSATIEMEIAKWL